MKKIKLLAFAVLFSTMAIADEGMWLPMFLEKLNYSDMKEKGLQLTADQIYSVNHSSIKDAIVRMGGGCGGGSSGCGGFFGFASLCFIDSSSLTRTKSTTWP